MPPKSACAQPYVFFLLISTFVMLAFGVISMPERFSRNDDFSERLVSESLTRFSQVGDSDIAGFMVAFQEEVHVAAVKEILGPHEEKAAYPYISNYNGQYEFGRFFISSFGLSSAEALRVISVFSAVATAVTIWMIIFAVRRDFGKIHAGVTLAPFLISILFLQRSISAYWQIFLFLLPFAIVMIAYPFMRNGWKFVLLATVVAVAIFFKSLTGYEYLTCSTISCFAPIFFHEFKARKDIRQGLIRFIVRCLAIGASCVAGFGMAVFLHLKKMAVYFGSLDLSLDAISLILGYSVLVSQSGIRGEAPNLIWFIVQIFDTFVLRNFMVNILFIVAILATGIGYFLCKPNSSLKCSVVDYFQSAVFGATLLSLIASASWSFVMLKHAVIHPHINWVQNYSSFYIFLAISLSEIWAKKFVGKAAKSVN